MKDLGYDSGGVAIFLILMQGETDNLTDEFILCTLQ